MEAQTITERRNYQGTTVYGTPPATWLFGNNGAADFRVRLKFVASANFSKASFTFDFRSATGSEMYTVPCYVGITTSSGKSHPAADTPAFTMGSTLGTTVTFNKQLTAGVTYYLWLWCEVSGAQNAWASNSQFTTSISCEMGGLAYIDDGTAVNPCMVYIDDGTAFGQYMPYIDNGTGWDACT